MENTINELERIIREYTPRLRELSEDTFSYKPAPAKWSGKEYLGHLIDSAQNNIRRFVVAQYQDKPFIVYDQEKWAAAADYQSYALTDLIDLWILINRHLVIVLKRMPVSTYEREVQTQELHSVQWLAEDYNKHLLHHLHQVLHLEPVAYP
jgi:DinB superfamily